MNAARSSRNFTKRLAFLSGCYLFLLFFIVLNLRINTFGNRAKSQERLLTKTSLNAASVTSSGPSPSVFPTGSMPSPRPVVLRCSDCVDQGYKQLCFSPSAKMSYCAGSAQRGSICVPCTTLPPVRTPTPIVSYPTGIYVYCCRVPMNCGGRDAYSYLKNHTIHRDRLNLPGVVCNRLAWGVPLDTREYTDAQCIMPWNPPISCISPLPMKR